VAEGSAITLSDHYRPAGHFPADRTSPQNSSNSSLHPPRKLAPSSFPNWQTHLAPPLPPAFTPPPSSLRQHHPEPETSGHVGLDRPPQFAHLANRPSQPGLSGSELILAVSKPANECARFHSDERFRAQPSDDRRDAQNDGPRRTSEVPACDTSPCRSGGAWRTEEWRIDPTTSGSVRAALYGQPPLCESCGTPSRAGSGSIASILDGELVSLSSPPPQRVPPGDHAGP
jgi:hypothetical protein